MSFIKAVHIQKSYGARKVVDGISLDIMENEILAVIGPNGAGKSTTIEMVVGLRKADQGSIKFWDEKYKTQIGVQLQSVPFFPGLTALENLQLFAAFYKKQLSKKEAMRLLTQCGLADCSHTDVSRLSGGQQKRLAIAAALVHDPTIVFLDEPSASLDPRSRLEIHQIISNLHTKGKTVVFSSHDMDEVVKLATRIIMIDQGQIIAEGDASHLCETYEVTNLDQLYLKLTSKEEVAW